MTTSYLRWGATTLISQSGLGRGGGQTCVWRTSLPGVFAYGLRPSEIFTDPVYRHDAVCDMTDRWNRSVCYGDTTSTPLQTELSVYHLGDQYIVSMTATEPVFRHSDQYWTSISSRSHMLNQYIVSGTIFDPVYHHGTTTDLVYHHIYQYWTSISSQWTLLTQYIVTVTSTDPVYPIGDQFRPSISSRDL